MPSCAVATCKVTGNTKKKVQVTFHRFPKDPTLSKIWQQRCKRADGIPVKVAVICSNHFVAGDFEPDLMHRTLYMKEKVKLKPTSLPSSNLPGAKPPPDPRREKRRILRWQKQTKGLTFSELGLEIETGDQNVPDNTHCDSSGSISEAIQKPQEKVIADLMLKLKLEKRKSAGLQLALTKKKNELLECQVQLRAQATSNIKLKKKTKSPQQMLSNVLKMFSPAQVRKLNGCARVNWTPEDIAKALAVMCTSKKAYETIRTVWGFPLPAPRAIRRWTEKFKCAPGFISEVFSLMKQEGQVMDQFKRLSVLNFDEMRIASRIEYDPGLDMVLGPHKNAQVMTCYGLCSKWRQPIYYDFDQKVTKAILFQALTRLEEVGFTVCAIVSDLGGTNRELWNELGATFENPKFVHPVTRRSIWVFADAPHLIKLVRNHLLDDGWWLSDGTVVNRQTLEAIISFDCEEIKLCPKLTPHHLTVKGAERMKVSTAAQVLSHHTSTVAKFVFPELPSVSKFFQLMDDFFDIFNSRVPIDSTKKSKSGFGKYFLDQTRKLDEIETCVSQMRAMFLSKKTGVRAPRKSMLPCQIGLLASTKALRGLYADVSTSNGVCYLLTRRLNQDPLESLFSVIRSLGRTNDHPDSSQFRYRLKAVLTGSKVAAPIGSNVTDGEESYYISAKLLELVKSQTEAEASPIQDDEIEPESLENIVSVASDSGISASLRYIAGYLAFVMRKKFKLKYGIPTSQVQSEDQFSSREQCWTRELSYGGLLIPNSDFLESIQRCEATFTKTLSALNLKKTPDILKRIRQNISTANPDVDARVVAAFSKLRLKIRLKLMSASEKFDIGKKRAGSKVDRCAKKAKQFVT